METQIAFIYYITDAQHPLGAACGKNIDKHISEIINRINKIRKFDNKSCSILIKSTSSSNELAYILKKELEKKFNTKIKIQSF